MCSLSKATIIQYGSTYRLWWPFCLKKGISPYEGTPIHVMEFLQDLFDKGNNLYGTFNSHRSALSLILSTSLSNHPVLGRFLKGISRLRPQTPRYNYVWDPQTVLNYLEHIQTDSLRSLSQKLITLLALTTAHRIQTLSWIRLPNIFESDSGFQILIEDRVKTSGVNRDQPCLQIPYFKKNPKLCVATTLKEYLCTTKEIRPQDSNLLFITYKKPYKTVSKQSLSRWVKDTLQQSGIDTTIFKAHSTRHASTSKAFNQRISLEVIRKTAGWTQTSSTFANFYNRPLSQEQLFSNTILSS